VRTGVRRWLVFLLGCAALTLNPILLDFLVAARGYGLAMAGLFWALFQMLAWFDEERFNEEAFTDRSHGGASEAQLRKRLWKAALGCSIAVAANLTLLMPVFVLAAAFCVLILRAREKPPSGSARRPYLLQDSQEEEASPKPRANQRAPTLRSCISLFPVIAWPWSFCSPRRLI
jgi:hypothetical protein